jgi:hypothetical protein
MTAREAAIQAYGGRCVWCGCDDPTQLEIDHIDGGQGQGNAHRRDMAVYFSPNGGALAAILQRIRAARKTILVQVHLFYSVPLAGALVRAHQRGVQVHVMLDAGAQPFDLPCAPSHT